MTDRTLLINQAFALRQRNGMPVFTSIKTMESQYNESELDTMVDKINKRKKVLGLTISECFDVKYKDLLKKTPKKNRIKIDHPIDLHRLNRIIITQNGKGYLSTAFLDFMREFNIPIYFVNGRGMIDSFFMPTYFKKADLVIKQAEARINGTNIEIAKYIIENKLESQGITYLIPDLKKAKNIDNILGIEANASRIYFSQWGMDIPARFHWQGRYGRAVAHNVNAVDPINSILNLGYGILAQQIGEILISRGFELSIGLLHFGHSHVYWNQLSYDIVEPFRVIIDNAVKYMAKNSVIEPEYFKFSDDRKNMILKDKYLEPVLERFMDPLKSLEHKSLPVIRKVEGMLS